jgi:choline dehydrogenase-like flavoprotein
MSAPFSWHAPERRCKGEIPLYVVASLFTEGWRQANFDLDPMYTDSNGDPLLRMTLDWRENERRLADFAVAKSLEIVRAMGATDFTPSHGLGSYDTRVYQSSRVQGGTIMGKSPGTSVVNPYLKSFSKRFLSEDDTGGLPVSLD